MYRSGCTSRSKPVYNRYSTYCALTVGENIIATTKIRNNYCAIQSFIFQCCDSNIGLFTIAPCKVISPNLLCILFGISSLLSFLMALSTIAIAVAIVGRAITIWEAIQKRSHEPIYKTDMKI